MFEASVLNDMAGSECTDEFKGRVSAPYSSLGDVEKVHVDTYSMC